MSKWQHPRTATTFPHTDRAGPTCWLPVSSYRPYSPILSSRHETTAPPRMKRHAFRERALSSQASYLMHHVRYPCGHSIPTIHRSQSRCTHTHTRVYMQMVLYTCVYTQMVLGQSASAALLLLCYALHGVVHRFVRELNDERHRVVQHPHVCPCRRMDRLGVRLLHDCLGSRQVRYKAPSCVRAAPVLVWRKRNVEVPPWVDVCKVPTSAALQDGLTGCRVHLSDGQTTAHMNYSMRWSAIPCSYSMQRCAHKCARCRYSETVRSALEKCHALLRRRLGQLTHDALQ